MSGETLTSGQKAHTTRMERLREKAVIYAKENNLPESAAFEFLKGKTYKQMVATRKANKQNKSKTVVVVKPKAKTEKLLPFSDNVGKQMVYTGMLSLAADLTTPLHALTMPGINTEFETRLQKENSVATMSFIERDEKIQKVIIKNFDLKSWSSRSSFPEDYVGDIASMRAASLLNYVWFDFMGKYLKKYTPAFRELIQVNEQTEMVFGITIGSRGGGKTISVSEVDDTLLSIFNEANWKVKNSLSCSYKSENGTRMTVLMYSLNRSERNVPNNERRKLEAQMAELQRKLDGLNKTAPKTAPTKPKAKTKRKYTKRNPELWTPEALAKRAKVAAAARAAKNK